MCFFHLPESQSGISKPYIFKIIFYRRPDIFSSLHVKCEKSNKIFQIS